MTKSTKNDIIRALVNLADRITHVFVMNEGYSIKELAGGL